jgi:hypothetical protein
VKRIGSSLAVAACILVSGSASASEIATPTWVAEETFGFKALASSSSTTLDPDQAADQIQALQAAHQAKISTPAAETERQQSIDAFTDLGALAATDLAIEVFEDQLQDLTTLATAPLLESETPPVFLSDTSARINPLGQEDSSLLVSSIPLRNQQGELVSGELAAVAAALPRSHRSAKSRYPRPAPARSTSRKLVSPSSSKEPRAPRAA